MNRAGIHSSPAGVPAAGPSPVARLDATVTADGISVSVALLGVRDDGNGPAFMWGDPDEPWPAGDVVVRLGERGDRGLHVDLARCPGFVTVLGTTGTSHRYALWLARQLDAAGVETAVLGAEPDDFDNALPPAVQCAASPAELAALGTTVVLCIDPDDAHIRTLSLLRGSLGTPIPVLLGSVPEGPWALTLHETQQGGPLAAGQMRAVTPSAGTGGMGLGLPAAGRQ